MQTMIPALVIRRTYPAKPERVYAAWTQPAIAKQFLAPEDVTAAEMEADVRVGGSYRIVMQMADGERMIATGVYREVVAPQRLSMTWRWLEDDPKDEHESLLTLEFIAKGSSTDFVLTHEDLASVESRSRHEHGWLSIAEKLGHLF